MRFFASIRQWLGRNDGKHVPGFVKARANMAYSFIMPGRYLTARQQLPKALEQRNDIRDRSMLDWLLDSQLTLKTIPTMREPTNYEVHPSGIQANFDRQSKTIPRRWN